jgi:hypothetical protein
VAKADEAVAALAAAKVANREFRTVGERRAAFDELNAMQKRNSGKIAEIPHTEAGMGLPNTFHERFFKKSARRATTEDGEQEWTSEDLVAAIAESEAHVEELKARLVDVREATEAATFRARRRGERRRNP